MAKEGRRSRGSCILVLACRQVALLIVAVMLLLLICGRSCEGRELMDIQESKEQQEIPTYVYAFGDSITDTGNSPIADPTLAGMVMSLPFGMTWFGHGSNRWSDGRLIVDWLCIRAYGSGCSPGAAGGLLPPHLAIVADEQEEVGQVLPRSQNYAVAGATALSPDALKQAANVNAITPDSLDVQVGWFLHDVMNASSVGGPAGKGTTLIHLGEIGGDDVNYALRDRMSPLDIQEQIVPRVISTVSQQLDRILSVHLAPAPITRVVIQGQFPMGCMPVYVLEVSANANANTSSNSSLAPDLDHLGCVSDVNAISDLQNELLLSTVIPYVAAKYPHVSFVFLDTSAAYRHILAHASNFGFSNLNDRVCDINTYILYGTLDQSAPPQYCSDPSMFVSWDGIHLTDAMAGALVELFLRGDGQGHHFSHPFPSFLSALASDS